MKKEDTTKEQTNQKDEDGMEYFGTFVETDDKIIYHMWDE